MYITGSATLFARQVKAAGDTFISYSASVSTKDKDGNWINASIPAILSKAARASLSRIEAKKIDGKQPTKMFKIDVEDGWFTVRTGKEYNIPAIFINKLAAEQPKEEKQLDMGEAPW